MLPTSYPAGNLEDLGSLVTGTTLEQILQMHGVSDREEFHQNALERMNRVFAHLITSVEVEKSWAATES